MGVFENQEDVGIVQVGENKYVDTETDQVYDSTGRAIKNERRPSYNSDRTTISEALGVLLVGGAVVCYEKIRRAYRGIKSAVTSLPSKGIEKVANSTIKGIGGLEEDDI
jgi:hypothetical protein